MIIDLILDRKDGHTYKVKEFYDNIVVYEEGTDYEISRALDGGTEKDVKKALCNYVLSNDYNSKICNYINKVSWLEDDASDLECERSFESIIDAYKDFLYDTTVQNTAVSSDYIRKSLITVFENLIGEIQDYVADLKATDKELKL